MSDTSVNQFLSQADDAAARTGFVPAPPTPAADLPNGYLCYQRDDDTLWAWNSDTAAWVQVAGVGSTIPSTVQGDLLYASAADTLSALNKDTNATRYLANTGSNNNPAWAQVNLANGVTGDLPLANLTQGSALSVLGVTGNATADNASIAAGSDHQVLRRSGTAVAFGQINVGQSAAITGILPIANGGTGSASGAAILKATVPITNAQIVALPTTPLTMVAAPGSGFRINFISASLQLDAIAAGYTADADGYWVLKLGSAEYSTYIANETGVFTQVTSLLTGGALHSGLFLPYMDISSSDWGTLPNVYGDAFENAALTLFADNNGTGTYAGGNAANNAIVTVYYSVESIIT